LRAVRSRTGDRQSEYTDQYKLSCAIIATSVVMLRPQPKHPRAKRLVSRVTVRGVRSGFAEGFFAAAQNDVGFVRRNRCHLGPVRVLRTRRL
jgi:hypothetical protein